MFKNKLYLIALLMVVLTIAVTGCGGGSGGGGGDTTNKPVDQATGQKFTSIAASQGLIDSAIQSLVVSLYYPTNPSEPKPGGAPTQPDEPELSITSQGSKSIHSQDIPTGFNDWFGPNSEGWYWRSYNWGYGDDRMTEYVRSLKPPEVGREYKSTYVMGSDATGKTTIDIYAKTVVKDGLLTGEYDVKSSSYGYSSIQTVRYRFTYSDFDPQTGAGTFEWWGGGDADSFVPYDRFLTIVATDNHDGETINVRVTYDGDFDWEWEYDCPYNPVVIPDLTGL